MILGAALRAAAKLAGPHLSAPEAARTSPVSDAVAPSPAGARSRAAAKARFRPRGLLLMGITCVIIGVALYVGARPAVQPQSAAVPTTASTLSGVVAPTRPNATSPAPDAAGTSSTSTSVTPNAAPPVTLTTIEPAALGGRLAQIAATAGFTILGLKVPSWKLAAVDTQTQGGESLAALSYVQGANFVTITQEKMATPPTLPGAQPITIRKQPGTLALMNPVVSLRWEEQGVAILLTTNLPRDAALALTDRLEPVP